MTRVLIVEARFYEEIADELARGAIQLLEQEGVDYDRISVPGAFEIPAAIGFARHGATSGGVDYDGYVALGCVIRGETTHYDYVCGESARGLQDLATRDGVALGYGILTVENADQAWARARIEGGKNKGRDAAQACLDMIDVKHKFSVT